MNFLTWVIGLVVIYILGGIKIINEYERGVRFTMGKYTGVMNPGLRIIMPIIQSYKKVDMRVKTVDVPSQECISKDNVSIKVNAVLYYKVSDVTKAILEVENFNYAVSQLAQTTMRNIIGEFELDGVLQGREQISGQIRQIVDKDTDPWGIKITKIEIKDIELPDDMKRVISKEAEAEREKRAVIIKAKGEMVAATNIALAAKTLAKSEGALHLRTLETLNSLSSDKSNTVVFAIPIEILEAMKKIKK